MDFLTSFQNWLGVTNTNTFAWILVVTGVALLIYAYYVGRKNRAKDREDDSRTFKDLD